MIEAAKDWLEKYADSLPQGSRAKYVAVARKFLAFAKEADKHNVNEYIHHLQDEQYADGTIEWEFRALNRFFRVNGLEWPFRRGEGPGIREMNVNKPALMPEMLEKMIQAARTGKAEPDAVCYLALSTIYGMRREELSRMDASRFEIENGVLFVETAKHGRQRYHAIPPEIMPYLKDVAPLLQRTSVSTITNIYHECEEAAGLTHIEETGWHAIRRSLVHFLIENGANQFAVNNFLRWKRSSTDMAARYHSVTLVGQGQSVGIAASDKAQDEAIFKIHPFLPFWR